MRKQILIILLSFYQLFGEDYKEDILNSVVTISEISNFGKVFNRRKIFNFNINDKKVNIITEENNMMKSYDLSFYETDTGEIFIYYDDKNSPAYIIYFDINWKVRSNSMAVLSIISIDIKNIIESN